MPDQDQGGDPAFRLREAFGPSGAATRRAFAPYRVSPFGAHTDHQDGLTCGFTLDRGITLTFRPRPDAVVDLVSEGFEGRATFELGAVGPPEGRWGDYARGVAAELVRRGLIARGLEGVVQGTLPPGGISTSAALQVAVLLALSAANGDPVPRDAMVDLVVQAERRHAGVQVGILDPMVILHGRERALVVIDCREAVPRLHRVPDRTPPFELVLVDSGRPRDLRTSRYNERVAECRDAARALGATGERPVLRDVAPETYRRLRPTMEPRLMRRAEHFFSEGRRVRQGLIAISQGDLDAFGRLMTASGESLTTFFECGTPETRALLEIVREEDGVYGASYAGGGFGGLVQALARPGTAARIAGLPLERYRAAFPEAGPRAHVAVVGLGPGAHVA